MSSTIDKPKGRGRPRKYPIGQSRSELLEAAREAGTLRKRGRPPKNPDGLKEATPHKLELAGSSHEEDNETLSNDENGPNKRKRGRPPKKRAATLEKPAVEESLSNKTEEPEPSSGKRKRGRPPKQ